MDKLKTPRLASRPKRRSKRNLLQFNELQQARSGGTGRRAGLKIQWYLVPCGFDPLLRDHLSLLQNDCLRIAVSPPCLYVVGLKAQIARRMAGLLIRRLFDTFPRSTEIFDVQPKLRALAAGKSPFITSSEDRP